MSVDTKCIHFWCSLFDRITLQVVTACVVYTCTQQPSFWTICLSNFKLHYHHILLSNNSVVCSTFLCHTMSLVYQFQQVPALSISPSITLYTACTYLPVPHLRHTCWYSKHACFTCKIQQVADCRHMHILGPQDVCLCPFSCLSFT